MQLGGRLGQIVRLPAEEIGEQRPDVGEALLVAVQQLLEALLAGSGVAVEDHAPLDQNRLGDDETDGLDEARAIPGAPRSRLWSAHRSSAQPVAGQR